MGVSAYSVLLSPFVTCSQPFNLLGKGHTGPGH
jgi:hypothetical protein